ncbi:MAG: hypothetical protein IIC79_07240 [Chloroflexi bacterium]|nr:hypothetical protein [Chloroflexota bacterium]
MNLRAALGLPEKIIWPGQESAPGVAPQQLPSSPTAAHTPQSADEKLADKAARLGFEDEVAAVGEEDFDPTSPADRAQITGAPQPQPSATAPRVPQSNDEKLADKAGRLGFEDEVAALGQPRTVDPRVTAALLTDGGFISGSPQAPAPQEPELTPEQEEAKRKLDGFTSALYADYNLVKNFAVGELPDHLKLENIRYTYDQYLAGIQDGTITTKDVVDLIFGRTNVLVAPEPDSVFTSLEQDDIGEMLDFVVSHEKSNFSIPPKDFIVDQMNLILQEAANQEYNLNTDQLAYIFATAHWESHWGYFDLEVADGSGYGDLEDLGNSSAAEGELYKGRGFVQLTGKNNYDTLMKVMGIDLINSPNLAYIPENAAFIIVYGMVNGTFGIPLSDFDKETGFEFDEARASINSNDEEKNYLKIGAMAKEYAFFLSLLCFAGLLPASIQCVSNGQ